MKLFQKKISNRVLKKIANKPNLVEEMVKLGEFDNASMHEFQLFCSNIQDASIKEFTWEKGLFSDATLKNCKLIDGKMTDIEFYGTQFFNVDFERIDFQRIEVKGRRQPFATEAILKKVRFINCSFFDATFYAIQDSEVEFINCTLRKTWLSSYRTNLKFYDTKTLSIFIKSFENIDEEPIQFLNIKRLRLRLISDGIQKLKIKVNLIDFAMGDCTIGEFHSDAQDGVLIFEEDSKITSLEAVFWKGGVLGALELNAGNVSFKCFSETLQPGMILHKCKINNLEIVSFKGKKCSFKPENEISNVTFKNCIFSEFSAKDSTFGSCSLSWVFIHEKVELANTTICRLEVAKTFLGENATWISENVLIDKLEKFDDTLSTKIKIEAAEGVSGSKLKDFFEIKHFDLPKSD